VSSAEWQQGSQGAPEEGHCSSALAAFLCHCHAKLPSVLCLQLQNTYKNQVLYTIQEEEKRRSLNSFLNKCELI
jgi:hypothetical protein